MGHLLPPIVCFCLVYIICQSSATETLTRETRDLKGPLNKELKVGNHVYYTNEIVGTILPIIAALGVLMPLLGKTGVSWAGIGRKKRATEDAGEQSFMKNVHDDLTSGSLDYLYKEDCLKKFSCELGANTDKLGTPMKFVTLRSLAYFLPDPVSSAFKVASYSSPEKAECLEYKCSPVTA